MATDEQKAKITLEAKDRASKTVKETTKNFGKLVAAITGGNLASRAIEKGLGLITKALGQLKTATMVAARIQVLNRVFYMTGQVAGYTKGQLESSKNAVMALGIAEQEALQINQRFIQAQLKLADATKVARAAQDLAVIAGQNSSETALRLTEAIVKQRPILLKQFGIIANLNDIYDRQADALGKTVEQLDQTEKRSAFLNEILRQSSTVAGAYTSAMKDVGKRLTSLPRHLQAAQNAIGKLFVPALGLAVDASEAFLKSITAAFSPPIDKLMTSMGKLAKNSEKFRDVSKRAKELRDEYAELNKIAEPTIEQQDRMREILVQLERILPGVVLQIDNQTGAYRAQIETLDELLSLRQEEIDQAAAGQLEEAIGLYDQYTREVQNATKAIEWQKAILFANTTATDEQRAAIVAKYEAERDALKEGTIAWQVYAGQVAAMKGEFIEIQGINTAERINQMRIRISELGESSKIANAEMSRIVSVMSAAVGPLEENEGLWHELGVGMLSAIISYRAANEAAAASQQAAKEADAAADAAAKKEKELAKQREQAALAAQAASNYLQGVNAGLDSFYVKMKAVRDAYLLGFKDVPRTFEVVEAELLALTNNLVVGQEEAVESSDKKTTAIMQTGAEAVSANLRKMMTANEKVRLAAQQTGQAIGRGAHQATSEMLYEFTQGRMQVADIWRGQARDFIQLFVQKALSALSSIFLPGLLKFLGTIFDTPANDRLAMRQGQHYAQWFARGALGQMRTFGDSFAGSAYQGSMTIGEPGPGPGPAWQTAGATVNFYGPVNDPANIRQQLSEAVEASTAFEASRVVIGKSNLTGDDDGRIL